MYWTSLSAGMVPVTVSLPAPELASALWTPLILRIFFCSCSAQASQCMFTRSSTVVTSLTCE
uniref:Uncharacterized protein n=1 Tax=Arundo donax TaxID=35708 RepID=A0A0A9E8Q1_ARUDO